MIHDKDGLKNIAVIIPCYNEEKTIFNVVKDFKKHLPDATIYVFDNNSSDRTSIEAEKSGAIVINEYKRGKGNVVRAMFRRVEADLYLIVDGDDTYSASDAKRILQPIITGQADMVVGDRISSSAYDNENKRLFHSFGNRLVRWLINKLFRSELNDIMSGYRGFNRFFVKTFPAMSDGFQIETELTLHALDKKFKIAEVGIQYKDRPSGSESKLNTYTDGLRILKTIGCLFKDYKPLAFFSSIAIFVAIVGIIIGTFPVVEYIRFSYVYKVPSAILASALELLSMLLFSCGLILDTIVRHHNERYQLYLNRYCEQIKRN